MTSEALARRTGPTVQELLDLETRPVPAVLREERNDYAAEIGTIDKERYYSPEFHRLESERMWSRVWQVACREEEIPNVGDQLVYRIGDISLIIVRSAADEIKAFYNACLHRGRTLCDADGNAAQIRCKFHGMAWRLDGQFVGVPTRWDFPHLKREEFALPEAKTGCWGGFVFINMDPDCKPLEDYLEDVPRHVDSWDFPNRRMATHVAKVVKANWKVGYEAFLEALHVPTTHGQVVRSNGYGLSQYDARKDQPHWARLILPLGLPTPPGPPISEQQIWESMAGPRSFPPELPPGKTARQHAGDMMRERLSKMTNGGDFSQVTDCEMIDGIVYFLFPNIVLFGGYTNILTRFRPWGNDPEQSVIEVMTLEPIAQGQPRKPPAPVHMLGPDETFADAPELGSFGPFFDQDLSNIPQVQEGLHSLTRPDVMLSMYQESLIRHFNRTLDMYVA